jgi:hypothetical protein
VPHSGDDLGVDLYNLWVSGSKHLPAIADQFRMARDEMNKSDSYDEAFRRSPSIGGDSTGPAHEGWLVFREAVVRVLQDSESNMIEAADGLRITAEQYATADALAGRKFADMKLDGAGGAY